MLKYPAAHIGSKCVCSVLKTQQVEYQHKALLIIASVIIKTFLMVLVSTNVMCGNASPQALFSCGENAVYVGGSAAAVAIMGFAFGHYVIKLKAFNKIFANMMGADFLVTAMYFGVAFISPDLVATKTMTWLFGTWILGMLLAPFNIQRTVLKKLSQYGGIVALGALFSLHFVPGISQLGQSFTAGMMVSSILSVFGGGRQR